MADSYQDMIDNLFAVQAGQAPMPGAPGAAAPTAGSGGTSASFNPYATPAYFGAQNQAYKTRKDATTNIEGQANLAASALGYNLHQQDYAKNEQGDIVGGGQFDAGSIDWDTIDTSNPYSRAALLKKNWMMSQRGSLNSLSDRGFGRSGALRRSLAKGTQAYKGGQDSLDKELQQIVLNANSGVNSAFTGQSGSMLDALNAALAAVPQA